MITSNNGNGKENYISSKGYVIYKENNDEIIKLIKKELLVEPNVCPGYGSDIPDSFKVYRENDKKIYVPVHYGIEKFGNVKKEYNTSIKSIDIDFPFDLRDYQKEIVKTYLEHVKDKPVSGGIISVGCGRGKTVMALNIIHKLNCKTLILVHKEFLMNQWRERIEQFLPDARIGVIQGKIIDLRNKDIILGMIQSLSDPRKDKDYNNEMFNDIGLLVADECHHLGAKQFSRSLMKHTFKYTLGLSATPNRNDGLTKVFKYFLGDIIYKDNKIKKNEKELQLEHIPDAIVDIIKYNNLDPLYYNEILNFKNRPNIVVMETNISKYMKRTIFTLNVLKCVLKNKKRKVLILSSRREHIFDLEEAILKNRIGKGSVGLYLGGMKQDDLDESTTKKIIIATFDMAEEAFDCKSLNTLILATPKKNIVQAVGRILREKKEDRKVIPLVIDICDSFSNFTSWNKIREKYYSTKKYELNYYDFNHEEGVNDMLIDFSTINNINNIDKINTPTNTIENFTLESKNGSNNSDSDSNDSIDKDKNKYLDNDNKYAYIRGIEFKKKFALCDYKKKKKGKKNKNNEQPEENYSIEM